MGGRVGPTKKRGTQENSDFFRPNGYFVLSLKLVRRTLEFIGKPFYLLLTFLFVVLFSFGTWLIRNLPRAVHLVNSPHFEIKREKSPSAKFKQRLLKSRSHLASPVKPNVYTVNLALPSLKLNMNFWRKKRFLLGLLIILIATPVVAFWFLVLHDLPKPGTLITRNQAVSTKIHDRKGKLLYKIYRNQNRTLLPLDKIPKYAREATVAIEDSGFYSHPGFSARGITRAFYHNLTGGQISGGSTITQQLVKNTLLSPERTMLRKLKEIMLAVQVETAFSKDQILEMYLNEVAYGGSAYGIEEASQVYFGKSARDLTLGEAALLTGLPKAPTTYSPFGTHPQKARERQLEVLAQMVQQGYISGKEADQAAKENLTFWPQRTDIRAPHFVMYIKEYLAEKYGEEVVEEGGLEVTTSLDLDIQDQVQKIVYDEVGKIHHLRISNGAALVTNPTTGEILAMVGSQDYWDKAHDGNVNVTLALRQPGSSIKPVNYSYALETKKFTAASIIPDSPITYRISGSEAYTPHNYDNTYRGNVTVRTALGSSLNIPAVKVLASYGVDKMITQGQKLGITTWGDRSRFGLSLTLGGGEVRMVDMNTVYGTLANYGKRVDLNPILSITDYKRRVVEKNTCATQGQTVGSLIPTTFAAEASFDNSCGTEVLDPNVAYILTDILKDNNARTPVFGPHSLLVIPDHPEVAVKTGTTQSLRDNWTIGYTQDYVVTTWVGNNDNTPMSYVASGITGASPIWHNIMQYLLTDKPSIAWLEPDGLVKASICPTSGTLACEDCGGKTEYFLPMTEPKLRCVAKTEEEKRAEEERKQAGGQIL